MVEISKCLLNGRIHRSLQFLIPRGVGRLKLNRHPKGGEGSELCRFKVSEDTQEGFGVETDTGGLPGKFKSSKSHILRKESLGGSRRQPRPRQHTDLCIFCSYSTITEFTHFIVH